MDGDEFRAVGKRAFHFDCVDHLDHTFHHGVERKNRRPRAHDLGDRLAVTDELEDFRGDQRHRFRMIELQATAAALLASSPVGEDEELVDFAGRQVHGQSAPG